MDRRRLRRALAVVAAVAAVSRVVSRLARILLTRRRQIGDAIIERIADDTVVDPETARSAPCSRGDVVLPEEVLEEPLDADVPRAPGPHLLALPDALHAGPHARQVHRARALRLLLFRPFELLAFRAPEYEMDDTRGIVRWRIDARRARRPAGPGRGRLPGDRRPAPAQSRPTGARASTSRSRSRTSTRRSPRRGPLVLRQHAVAHPRPRLLRLPALAGPARPRRESGVGRFADRRRRPRPAGAAAERAPDGAHGQRAARELQPDGAAA